MSLSKIRNLNLLDWPILTKHRLFLPYFGIPCRQHPLGIDLKNSDPKIGQGQFGTVFSTLLNPTEFSNCPKIKKFQIQNHNEEQIAVKVLQKRKILQENALIQIIEEIRIHSVCSGLPHVLPFIRAWQNSHNVFVGVALCNRGSLADLFKSRQSKFPSQAVIMAAKQIHTGKSNYCAHHLTYQ